MKIARVVFACACVAAPAVAAPPEFISVPSDPRATYVAIDVKKSVNGMIEVTTIRRGSSGTPTPVA